MVGTKRTIFVLTLLTLAINEDNYSRQFVMIIKTMFVIELSRRYFAKMSHKNLNSKWLRLNVQWNAKVQAILSNFTSYLIPVTHIFKKLQFKKIFHLTCNK